MAAAKQKQEQQKQEEQQPVATDSPQERMVETISNAFLSAGMNLAFARTVEAIHGKQNKDLFDVAEKAFREQQEYTEQIFRLVDSTAVVSPVPMPGLSAPKGGK